VRLSQFSDQLCWAEEIPLLNIARIVRSVKITRLQSGKMVRKGEQVEYVVNRDTRLLYLRYTGDERFVQGWQTCTFVYIQEGRSWCHMTACCPFCGSPTEEFYFWIRNIRCHNCFRYRSRWERQMRMTRGLRHKIDRGDLLSVAEGLTSADPTELYRTMIAMEMAGLSERKLTVAKNPQRWTRVADK
jgi:hypothetical protein